MREYWVKNTRILHFEKYMSQDNKSNSCEKNKKKEPESDLPTHRIYKNFFSLGYYDQLSYVRCAGNDTFDYRHCFLLKYPYQESKRQTITDQVFTLNDIEETVDGTDPFEYQGKCHMPFLGIILVTASGESNNQICTENMYEDLIEALKQDCMEYLKTLNADYFCYKFFYTPNCADLCIVIRTVKLDYVYQLKQHISGLKVTISGAECHGVYHAISYTVAEPADRVWGHEIIESNKTIGIELRLSGKGHIIKKIEECLRSQNQGVVRPLADPAGGIYGITGAGQYAIEVDFKTFAEIYPFLGMMKLDDPEKVKCNDPTELQQCFIGQSLECSYMRAKYQPAVQEDEVNAPEWEHFSGKIVSQYKDKMDELKEQIYAPTVSLEGMVREKELMLRELFNTYNDFWYRPCSWWKGVWFYAQLESVIDGINSQTELLRKYACNTERTEKERRMEKMADRLCKDITLAVSAVNNFNRLLLSINQYVLNVPNYEIQAKVNVEKYLMAYTAYLLAISSNYRKQIEPEKRVVPFIALDLTIGGIKADTLFGMRESFTDNGEALLEASETCFVIRFPNYQWLANIYHVLPMITHEMSHNFRYMSREKRNAFAWEYLLRYLSNYFLEQIMEPIRGCRNLYYGSFEHYLLEHIYETLKARFEEESFPGADVKFRDIGEYVRKFYVKTIGIYNENIREHKRWQLIADELLALAEMTEMDYVRPEDLEKSIFSPAQGWVIFFNAIVDIFNTKIDKRKLCCNKWMTAVKRLHKKCEMVTSMKTVLLTTQELLHNYEEFEAINRTHIFSAVRIGLMYWKEKNENISQLYKKDDSFSTSFDAIIAMEKLPEIPFGAVGEDKSNTEVSERMACFEKLNRIRQCVGNIMTNMDNDPNKKISDREDSAEKFSNELHRRLHEDYLKRLEKRHNGENLWITFKTEQSWLVSIGIVNPDRKQFTDYCRNIVSMMKEVKIKEIVEDQMNLYEEIFADMGMCKAFGFTAYGYFMYTIHIFMKERDIPREPLNDFTRDRIKTLLAANYAEEIGMDKDWRCEPETSRFFGSLEMYWQDLRTCMQKKLEQKECEKWKELKTLITCDGFFDLSSETIRKVLESDEKEKYGLTQEEKQHLEILRWMWRVYNELDLENLYIDNCMESLLLHIRKSEEGMDKICDSSLSKTWFELCREDESVQDIGEYYNNYSYSAVMRDQKIGRCLKYQDKFIAKSYAHMFDCIHQIRCRMKPDEKQKIVDLLFEYDFAKKGGTV